MIRMFIQQFGWFGLVRLCLYPLTLFIINPIRLLQSLWACRVLGNGQWGYYPHCHPVGMNNNLFYNIVALEIYRHGRTGKSKLIGLGKYDLSRYYCYALPSLYAAWQGGAVAILTGMFGWWLAHLIWLQTVEPMNLIPIMGLSLISTTFYGHTFARQNYNALGWLFFPIGIYGLMTGQWFITSLGWVAVSFGSFTAVILACWLSLWAAVNGWTIVPVIAVVPAGLKLVSHLWPYLTVGGLKGTMGDTLKAIGAADRKARYKRDKISVAKIGDLYFFLLYIQFSIVFYYLTQTVPLLYISGIVMFLINSIWLRIGDIESMEMLMISLASASMMTVSEPLLILSFWLVIAPISLFANIPTVSFSLDIVPKLMPINIKTMLEEMEAFLQPVSKGQRVLMAFENPGDEYEKLFDGYRNLIEIPHYVATKRGIHFMPDWWGVFELNYEGAPDFWGRDIEDVIRQQAAWNVDYMLIYQEDSAILDKKWEKRGFKAVSHFSWAKYAEAWAPLQYCKRKMPDWWLLAREE